MLCSNSNLQANIPLESSARKSTLIPDMAFNLPQNILEIFHRETVELLFCNQYQPILEAVEKFRSYLESLNMVNS